MVYADWLIERGDSRGEFIQIQCELADPTCSDDRKSVLRSRELQLIRQHSKGWARSIRKFANRWTFERGLISRVRIDARKYLENTKSIFCNHPVTGIEFLDFRNPQVVDAVTAQKQKYLEQLQFLGVVSGMALNQDSEHFVNFLNSPRLSKLRGLLVHSHVPSTYCVKPICQSLYHLEKLAIVGESLVYDDVEQLIQELTSLKSLSLQYVENYNDFQRPDYFERLPAAIGPALKTLNELELFDCGGLTLQALLRMNVDASDKLRVLRIKNLQVETRILSINDWKIFLDSTLLRHVDRFCMVGTRLPVRKFEQATHCFAATNWRHFKFSHGGSGPKHAKLIANSFPNGKPETTGNEFLCIGAGVDLQQRSLSNSPVREL